MKTIKIQGKTLRSGDYNIRSVSEEGEGLEIDTPSFLANLLSLRKKLKEPIHGFEYFFPMSFDSLPETNGFRITFPLIFEN